MGYPLGEAGAVPLTAQAKPCCFLLPVPGIFQVHPTFAPNTATSDDEGCLWKLGMGRWQLRYCSTTVGVALC